MTERRILIIGATVNAREAGAMLCVSAESIRRYCERKLFRSARKCGVGRTSPWVIDRDEVIINAPKLQTGDIGNAQSSRRKP